MARKDDEEGYDRRLQDLMQDCLPNILVELVEQRPPDPIEAMATALYRYRHLERPVPHIPPNTQTANIKACESFLTAVPVTQTSSMENDPLTKVKIVQSGDFDDSIYDMDLHMTETKNIKVHDSLLGLFRYIGDLFDDDDLL